MSEIYGYELIIDLGKCNAEIFTEEHIETFCKELCKVIDMKAEDFHIWASDPKDYHLEPDHIYGVSAVQFIITSTITIHALTKLRTVYVNVFSCKDFDKHLAMKYIVEFFEGVIIKYHFIERLK